MLADGLICVTTTDAPTPPIEARALRSAWIMAAVVALVYVVGVVAAWPPNAAGAVNDRPKLPVIAGLNCTVSRCTSLRGAPSAALLVMCNLPALTVVRPV